MSRFKCCKLVISSVKCVICWYQSDMVSEDWLVKPFGQCLRNNKGSSTAYATHYVLSLITRIHYPVLQESIDSLQNSLCIVIHCSLPALQESIDSLCNSLCTVIRCSLLALQESIDSLRNSDFSSFAAHS